MNEKYLALLGGIAGRYWWGIGHWDREGSPTSVNFDSEQVLQKHQELVGFYHTHPGFIANASSTDIGTMNGWCVALGKPLACCIEGVDGLRCHWFIDDENRHVTSWAMRFGRILVGRVPGKVLRRIKNVSSL